MTLKVLLVPLSGYLCRNDIFSSRLRFFESVCFRISFRAPDDHYRANTALGNIDLLVELSSSPGALIARDSITPTNTSLDMMEECLRTRLAFDWVLPNKSTAKKVAVIGSHPLFGLIQGSFGSRGPFEAFETLGTSPTVVDRPGHWLENDDYSHLRNGFVSLDMNNDSGLPYRIAAALEHKQMEGIVTFSTELILATSVAATLLGLPGEHPSAILRSQQSNGGALLSQKRSMEVNNPNHPLSTKPFAQFEIPKARYSHRAVSSNIELADHASGNTKHTDGMSRLETHANDKVSSSVFNKGTSCLRRQHWNAFLVLWEEKIVSSRISRGMLCEALLTDNPVYAPNNDKAAKYPTSGQDFLHPDTRDDLTSLLHLHLLQFGFKSGVFCLAFGIHGPAFATDELKISISSVESRPVHLDCEFASLHSYATELCTLHVLRSVSDRALFLKHSLRLHNLGYEVGSLGTANI